MKSGTAFLAAGLLAALSDAYHVPIKRDAVTTCLEGAKVPYETKASADWTSEIQPYNLRIPILPVAVVKPTTAKHIQDAVKCAADNGIKVSAKAGGHSYANFGWGGEDGHLVVKLDDMYGVELGKDSIAKIQPGARLGHVATELYNQGKRALAHGSCPGVGIAGHSLHGGYGFASRTHGLTLDWLVGANVVLPNGTAVHCSKTENSDLFWALRGAGSSFGIVSGFEFNTFAAPAQATYFTINVEWGTKDKVVSRQLAFQEFGDGAPKELNMRVIYGPGSQGFDGVYYGDQAGLETTLKPFLDKIGATISTSGTVGWVESLEHNAGAQALDQTGSSDAHDTFYSTSLAVKALTQKQIESFVDAITANVADASGRHSWYILVDLQGGAVSQVKNADTAYAHRDKLFLFQFYDSQSDGTYPAEGFTLLKGLRQSISKTMQEGEWGMYINYPDTQLKRQRAQEMYWGSNLERLQQIKAKWDPEQVFSNPQGVSPAA